MISHNLYMYLKYAVCVSAVLIFNLLISPVSLAQVKTVDLGLSVKWASCNVGAKNPEELGDRFAWGRTVLCNEKVDNDYIFYDVKIDTIKISRKDLILENAESAAGEKLEESTWAGEKPDLISVLTSAAVGAFMGVFEDNKKYNESVTIKKYNTVSQNGKVDNKTVLDLVDDAAYKKMGSMWRIPTSDEIKELIEKCKWSYTTLNEIKGFDVTGPNGNKIFIPLDSNLNIMSTDYWTGTLLSENPYRAYTMSLSRIKQKCVANDRRHAFLIRPVRR